MNIVVDKMHMAGHVDAWCKEYCDPRKFKELNEVYTCTYMNTQIMLIGYKPLYELITFVYCRLTLKLVNRHSPGFHNMKR